MLALSGLIFGMNVIVWAHLCKWFLPDLPNRFLVGET